MISYSHYDHSFIGIIVLHHNEYNFVDSATLNSISEFEDVEFASRLNLATLLSLSTVNSVVLVEAVVAPIIVPSIYFHCLDLQLYLLSPIHISIRNNNPCITKPLLRSHLIGRCSNICKNPQLTEKTHRLHRLKSHR